MTTQNPDAPPANALDGAFALPERFRGQPLEEVYNEIVSRMRSESAGLPMNTLQTLMIDRIAFTYITMKDREANDSWSRPTEMKELQGFWSSTTQEFNRLLNTSGDKAREALIAEVYKIVLEAIKLVSSEEELRKIRLKLAEDFAAIGL